MYTPGAVNCNNLYADKTCETIYNVPTEDAPVPGAKTARPLKCFTALAAATDPVEPDLVKTAAASCPKTCGYCCESPDYKCPNVQCKFLTLNMRIF